MQIHPLTHSLPDFNDIEFEGLGLDSHNVVLLRVYVMEFRNSRSRIASEYITMCGKLAMMKEILGKQFMPFAVAQLGLLENTVRRYLRLHDVMQQKLSTDGRVDILEARQFTQKALMLLEPIEDEDVIGEVRSLAQSGGAVNDETIRKIIASRDVDFTAKLQQAELEAAAAIKSLEEEKRRAELESAQNQSHIIKQDEIIRRSLEQVGTLEEDIQRLEKQATVVTTVEKPIVPVPYRDLEAAIAAKKVELADAQVRAENAVIEAEAAEKVSADRQEQLIAFSAQTEDFVRIKAVVEDVMRVFPQAQLQSLVQTDPGARYALESMGEALVQFGQSLLASAKTAG